MITTNPINLVILAILKRVIENGVGSLPNNAEATSFNSFLTELDADPSLLKSAMPQIREGYENGLRILVTREQEAKIEQIESVLYTIKSMFNRGWDLEQDLQHINSLIGEPPLQVEDGFFTADDFDFLKNKANSDGRYPVY